MEAVQERCLERVRYLNATIGRFIQIRDTGNYDHIIDRTEMRLRELSLELVRSSQQRNATIEMLEARIVNINAQIDIIEDAIAQTQK